MLTAYVYYLVNGNLTANKWMLESGLTFLFFFHPYFGIVIVARVLRHKVEGDVYKQNVYKIDIKKAYKVIVN